MSLLSLFQVSKITIRNLKNLSWSLANRIIAYYAWEIQLSWVVAAVAAFVRELVVC